MGRGWECIIRVQGVAIQEQRLGRHRNLGRGVDFHCPRSIFAGCFGLSNPRCLNGSRSTQLASTKENLRTYKTQLAQKTMEHDLHNSRSC